MFTFTSKFWFRKLGAITALIVAIFIFLPNVSAGDEDDAKEWMKSIQNEVSEDYNALDERVKKLDSNDPRKSNVNKLLDDAKSAKNTFTDLEAGDHLNLDTLRPDSIFLKEEQNAKEKINAVKIYLLKPVHPGAEGIEKEGTVPSGTLTEDFIPQFVRLLMRFASLGILVAFVVSGVMFVTAFGSDERLGNAKKMLYYSLIGFAFIALAFAIVKAITDIDFFGVI